MRTYLAAGLLGGFLSLIPASAVSSDNSSITFEDRRVIRINLSESQSQHQENDLDVNQSVEVNVTNTITVSPEPAPRVVQSTIQPASRLFSPSGIQRVTPVTETKGGLTTSPVPNPSPTTVPGSASRPRSTPTASPIFSPVPSPTPDETDELSDGVVDETGETVSPSPEEATATPEPREETDQRSFFGRIYDGIRERLRSIGRFLRSIGLG